MGETSYQTLLTHPGSAHKDELLACCVLLADNPVAIERREPTEQDLANPAVAVIDVGDRHEPELGNFDHHQLPRHAPPTCSLSLVLMRLGLYEDARTFCDWLETAEWFDCRGPKETAAWLGIERDALAKLNSPIDLSLLRRFAAATIHRPGETVWEMMRLVGRDLIDYLTSTRARIEFVAEHCQIWEIGALRFLFLPRVDSELEDPSAGIGAYVRETGLDQNLAATVYPDRRGQGYGITRYNDHPAMDFCQIETEPDVHFAHKSGFVAKTSATTPDRLQQLLAAAINSPE